MMMQIILMVVSDGRGMFARVSARAGGGRWVEVNVKCECGREVRSEKLKRDGLTLQRLLLGLTMPCLRHSQHLALAARRL